MSTRSIITFKSEEGILQVYKHWDGYPETTVPELQEFLKWNGHRNDQLDYTMANYCYWYKNRHFKDQMESHWKAHTDSEVENFVKSHNSSEHTGLGICHGKPMMNYSEATEEYNAEYFYIVDLVENRIYEEASSQYWDFTHETPKKYMGYVLEYRSIDWRRKNCSRSLILD